MADRENQKAIVRRMLNLDDTQDVQPQPVQTPQVPERDKKRDIARSIVAQKITEQYQETQPDKEDEGGIVNRAVDTVVDAGGKLFSILDIPSKYVGRPLAGLLSQHTGFRPRIQPIRHGLALNPFTAPAYLAYRNMRGDSPVDVYQSIYQDFRIPEEQRQAVEEADSYTEAYRESVSDLSGLEKFGVELSVDPLNLVGVGLGSTALGAVRGATAAGRAAGLGSRLAPTTRLGRVADTVADIDDLIGHVMALPITAPTRLVGRTVGPTRFGQWVGRQFEPSELGERLRRVRDTSDVATEQRIFTSEGVGDQFGLFQDNRLRQLENEWFVEATENAPRTLHPNVEERILDGTYNPYDAVTLLRSDSNRQLILANDTIRNRLVDAGVLDGNWNVTSFGTVHTRLNNALSMVGVDISQHASIHKSVDFVDDALQAIGRNFDNTKFNRPGQFYYNLDVVSDVSQPTRLTFRPDEGRFTLNIGTDANVETVNRELLGGAFFELSGGIAERATLGRSMGLAPNTLTKEVLGNSIIDFLRTHRFADTNLNLYAVDIAEQMAGLPLSGAPSLGRDGQRLVTARLSNTYASTLAESSQLFRMKRFDSRTGQPIPGWGESGFPQTRQQMMTRQGFIQTRQGQERAREAASGLPEFREVPLAPVTRGKYLSQLADDASFEEYIGRTMDLEGLQAERVTAVVERLRPIIDRNPEHFQYGAVAWNPAFHDNLVRAIREPANEAVYLAQALEAVNLERAAFSMRNPYLYTLARLIPDLGPRMSATQQSRNLGRVTDEMLRDDRVLVERLLNSDNELVHQGLQEMQENIRIVDAAVDRLRNEVPVSGLSDAATFETLRANPRVRELMTPEEILNFEQALEKIGGMRGTTARADAWRTYLAKNYMDDLAIQQNPKSRDNIMKKRAREDAGLRELRASSWRQGAEWVTQAWREQALLSVRYQVTNALDMIIKSAIHGVLANPLRSEGSAISYAQKLGWEHFPPSIRDAIVRDSSMVAQAATPEAESRIANFFFRSGFTNVGNMAEKLIGGNRHLSMWMETSARAAAWKTGVDRHLRTLQPRYFAQMRSELARQGVPSDAIERVIRQMDYHTAYSPQDVSKWLTNNGVPSQLAAQQAQAWGRMVEEASRVGERLALRVHFDYATETVIEARTHIRHILPFHIWATRNIPFYLQTLAENPWAMRVYRHWNAASESEKEQLGLTERFRGKIMLPESVTNNAFGSAVVSFFLGPGHHGYNPLVGISIFDQIKQPYIPDPEEDRSMTQVGAVIGQARRIGFSPAPWIDLPLNVLGAYGTQEPFGLWRQGDLISGAIDTRSQAWTGQLPGALVGRPEAGVGDIAPTVRIITGLRNWVGLADRVDTITGSQWTDRAINYRIRELAYQETGDGQHPLYTLAMTDPTSEIYQRASREVRAEQYLRTGESFVHPLPRATVSETELESRRLAPRVEYGEMPDFVMNWLRDAGHPSTQLWQAPRDEKRTQIAAGWTILRDDSLSQEQKWDLIHQLGLHWFDKYYSWRQAQNPGADLSVDRWIRTL